MLFQVAHIGILGRLFRLVCIMDQQVETIRPGIGANGRQKLLLMEHHECLYGLAEDIQESSALGASVSPGSLVPLQTGFGIL